MKYLIATLIFASSPGYSEILFEGFYRVELEGKHVGVAVQRWEQDGPNGVRTLKLFVKTKNRDHEMVKITLTEKQEANYKPLEYWIQVDKNGVVSKDHVVFDKNGFKSSEKGGSSNQITADTILSSAINYVMFLNSPQKGKVYSYEAVKEDAGKKFNGQVRVVDVRSERGRKVYRFLDDYELNPQEMWVLDNGEILRSRVPDRGGESTLVAKPDEAMGGLDVNRNELIPVFGEIPQGKKNAVSRGEFSVSSDFFVRTIDTTYSVVKDAIPLRLKKPTASK